MLSSVASQSQLLASLVEATAQRPTGRKRLLAPDVNFARELLVAVARQTGGWIGWEATSLRTIADELAFVPLSRDARRIAGDIEIAALVNESVRECIAARQLGASFVRLEPSQGFRRAVRNALLELRAAGVSSQIVIDRAQQGSGARDLGFVLAAYERLLAARRLADAAAVFETALAHFDEQKPYVLDGELWIVEMPITPGLPQRLADRLRDAGARQLASETSYPDGTLAFEPESADVFAGATPSEELREVFRRMVAEGCRFDDVEIAATDPDAYGGALDVLCAQLGVGATMLHGVPLARTRLGRALERWFTWLDDGLPADVLRQAIEAGDLGTPALAREVRRLRIGWGRARYSAASHLPEIKALLEATPLVPERGSTDVMRATVASLATATLQWLALVNKHGVEELTAMRLENRLREIASVAEPETTFANALASLKDALGDLRAWPGVTRERKPWASAGGMVHLTDLAHAGTTGRRRVFVVGLDAERTAGAGLEDPLLPDRVRNTIAPGLLLGTTQRRRNREWQAVAALNGLHGCVTLSYATSGNLDGRESGPSALLLQAWRQIRGDEALSYEDLRKHVRPPASAIPGGQPVDKRDVWLGAIADGALLRDGTAVVREAYPMLDAGLAAVDARGAATAGPHDGIVAAAAGKLDPSREQQVLPLRSAQGQDDKEQQVLPLRSAQGQDDNKGISPSSLELLAKCPLAWFYRYGLGIKPPEEPEYDAESWLDALQRGSLLHEVYEEFTKRYKGRQAAIREEAAAVELREIVDAAIARWREIEPPPGQTVFESEAAALRQAALVFLAMERDGDAGAWRETEMAFENATFEITPGRVISVRGRVDRVDDMPDGSLRVVDYKTGSNYSFRKSGVAFNGGRQLQAAIYSSVVASTLGRSVTAFEYRFPTEKGRGEVVAYEAQELGAAQRIVADLLEHLRTGAFIPTDDPSDCKFCEYGTICRVAGDVSPRAKWAEEHGPLLEVYGIMRRLRGSE